MPRHSWADMCRIVMSEIASGSVHLSDFEGQKLACVNWLINRNQITSTPSGGTWILSIKGKAPKGSRFKYHDLNG